MKTRHGIYNDITESDYFLIFNEVVVYFTSKNNMAKFLTRLNLYHKRSSKYLSKLYGLKVEAEYIDFIRLYMQTERRGFKIIVKGVEVLCPENIQFSINLISKKNLKDLTRGL